MGCGGSKSGTTPARRSPASPRARRSQAILSGVVSAGRVGAEERRLSREARRPRPHRKGSADRHAEPRALDAAVAARQHAAVVEPAAELNPGSGRRLIEAAIAKGEGCDGESSPRRRAPTSTGRRRSTGCRRPRGRKPTCSAARRLLAAVKADSRAAWPSFSRRARALQGRRRRADAAYRRVRRRQGLPSGSPAGGGRVGRRQGAERADRTLDGEPRRTSAVSPGSLKRARRPTGPTPRRIGTLRSRGRRARRRRRGVRRRRRRRRRRPRRLDAALPLV